MGAVVGLKTGDSIPPDGVTGSLGEEDEILAGGFGCGFLGDERNRGDVVGLGEHGRLGLPPAIGSAGRPRGLPEMAVLILNPGNGFCGISIGNVNPASFACCCSIFI